ncbi:facilitated trehalose transporter Tret1-like [Fopius arisanus]|uniref:Facilitated trehalose transporter Tret1-like n=1 Tax=Fopius arisanus TaxID=64838 RepID=A0A9R1TA66_9HYME|nr:PREDICTED: facilitated trehalose transporter Tret1-like [Fopius arisanus]
MEEIKMRTDKPSKLWSQWLAALSLHLLAVLDGLVAGWTSPYLAKLTNGTESLTITNNQASWIASLYLSSQPIGSIFAAVIVRTIGTKKAVLFAGIPHALGWMCFLISESVPAIYTARIFGGSGFGIYYSTFPLYIGEIADPKIRGALVGVVAQGTGIGYLIGNFLGAYLPMRTFAVIGLTMSIIYMLSFFLIPDSSHYLIKRNKLTEAEKSLKWYNRKKDVKSELDALITYIGKTEKFSLKAVARKFLSPLNRKLLIIIIGINLFMHLSGVYVIAMYLEILLTTLKINVIAPSVVVIGVGVVAIIGGLVTTYTNDYFGRRTMLAVSALGVSVNFFLIGIDFLLMTQGYNISNYQIIIIAEFMLYIFFLNIGLANIPCCLLSEIFPTELKEFGSCTVSVVSAFAAFLAGKSYQPILDGTSEEFVFFLSAFALLFMFIYTITVVPETKGKSLREIQEMLMNKSERIEKIED